MIFEVKQVGDTYIIGVDHHLTNKEEFLRRYNILKKKHYSFFEKLIKHNYIFFIEAKFDYFVNFLLNNDPRMYRFGTAGVVLKLITELIIKLNKLGKIRFIVADPVHDILIKEYPLLKAMIESPSIIYKTFTSFVKDKLSFDPIISVAPAQTSFDIWIWYAIIKYLSKNERYLQKLKKILDKKMSRRAFLKLLGKAIFGYSVYQILASTLLIVFPQTNYLSISAIDFRNVIISKVAQKIKGKKVIINGNAHFAGLIFYKENPESLETKYEFYNVLSKILTRKEMKKLYYLEYELKYFGNKIIFPYTYRST